MCRNESFFLLLLLLRRPVVMSALKYKTVFTMERNGNRLTPFPKFFFFSRYFIRL